jgi:alpha-L-fucosidase
LIGQNAQEETLIRSYFDQMQVDISAADCTKVSPNWRSMNQIPNYCRMYFIVDGEGWIQIRGKEYYPGPGQLFILPAGVVQSFASVNDNTFTKYWCHFTAKVGELHLLQLLDVPFYVQVPDTVYVERLFRTLLSAYRSHEPYPPLQAKAAFLEIFSYYVRHCKPQSIQLSVSPNATLLNQLLSYIDVRLGEPLTVEELAKVVNYTPNYFNRFFKKMLNMTPVQYILKARMERAKRFLATTDLSLKQIAGEIGMDIHYFQRMFKRSFGSTPKHYRESNRHQPQQRYHMLSDQAELDVETNRYWEAWIRPDGEGETEWPRVTLEESPLQVAGKWVPPPVDSSPNRLALPSPSQIRWHDLELGMFCHFGLNTYTEREWGDGTDPPSLFHPEQFDARQWVRVAKRAGFRYLVLTAKHHDGFCLWPTRTTDYSVRSSPWRNGNGDVVKEVAEACREEGLLFGLYLSPWDRHAPCYQDQAAYDDMYAEQLTELLTGYGPIAEIWFDGAGSEGRTFDWERFTALMIRYQPEAMRVNMGKPTVRWIGNELGVAPYPCWNTMESKHQPGGLEWVPAECNVPLRKRRWFWHTNEESKIHELSELLDMYYLSVGNGCNLLLNVAPDARGLIPEADARRVAEFHDELQRRFAKPLVDLSGQGSEMTVNFSGPRMADHVILMEDLHYGERVTSYVLEAEFAGEWIPIVRGSAIGHKKIDRFTPVRTERLRFRTLQSTGTPVIRRFAVFHSAEE